MAIWTRLDTAEGEVSGSAPGGTTYLLLGSDARGDVSADQQSRFGSRADVPGERADIVVLLRVGDDGSVRALGIPRDLVVYRPHQGPDRIALLLGQGPVAIADALCNSLGIGVDHVVEVGFGGLRDLVDLAGGIDVRSDAVLADRNSGLVMEAGVNHLDGDRALAYVRARNILVLHDGRLVPDGVRNGQRSERAIEVMGALSDGLEVGVSSPLQSQRAVWTAAGAVTVDGGTGPFDLLALTSAARKLTGDHDTTRCRCDRCPRTRCPSRTSGWCEGRRGSVQRRRRAAGRMPDAHALPAGVRTARLLVVGRRSS